MSIGKRISEYLEGRSFPSAPQDLLDAIRRHLEAKKVGSPETIAAFLEDVEALLPIGRDHLQALTQEGRSVRAQWARDRHQVVAAARNLLEQLEACHLVTLLRLEGALQPDPLQPMSYDDVVRGPPVDSAEIPEAFQVRALEQFEKQLLALIEAAETNLPSHAPKGRPAARESFLIVLFAFWFEQHFGTGATWSRETAFHDVMREVLYAVDVLSEDEYLNEASIESRLRNALQKRTRK